MGRKSWIAVITIVVLVLGAVGAAYAYDSSHKDEIAQGITIGDVDVGGLTVAQAEAKLRRQLVDPLRESLVVKFDGDSWRLDGEKLKIHADLEPAIAEALERSQEGGVPGRLARYVSGDEIEESIQPQISFSGGAINRFVRHVAAEINREPENASVEPASDSLEIVSGHEGRKLRDNLLTEELSAAVLGGGNRKIKARVHATEPEVTKREIAARYPSYLTLDRANFKLRLWQGLKLTKTYTVAVGQEGLETPEGLYEIQVKEENPIWHVPESDWAGDLAGETIPPGPSNPIKARWMAIYEGAGIHGTEEVESLGSAASHGCVRMAIADVEELYDMVEVGTPIFIG
ncbi:MAG: L,D-transpeptidase family protein [Actinobacteria bacterium]|nr:L,D-transpeptidase family protein [Actinomycetota bacterium]